MKKAFAIFMFLLGNLTLRAQTDELQLAQQFTRTGELQKAADIYSKLYKQSNEDYFIVYVSALLDLKKFDDAETVSKKMIKKHPDDFQYKVELGKVYREKGDEKKANDTYDEIIISLTADQSLISIITSEFYQVGDIDYAIKTLLQGRKLFNDDNLYTNELISLYGYKHDKPSLIREYLNFLRSNPEYITQAENTFATIFEGADDYTTLKTALVKLIQQYPQQIVYDNLLSWQFLQQKQFGQAVIQAIAISRRKNDDGRSVFELCRTLTANMAYDEAIQGYEFILSKGKEDELYIPAKVGLITAKNFKVMAGIFSQADLLGLEKDYQDILQEFGENRSTAFAMQKLANLEAFKLHKTKEAEMVLERTIKVSGIEGNLLANCKLDLGDVYLMNNKPWDAALIYSQVQQDFQGTSIGEDASYRNARLAYFTGDFTYAKGQLDVLKAVTEDLIANDALNLSLLISDQTAVDSLGKALKIYARADFQIFEEEPDRAMLTLDSINTVFPENTLMNDINMAKARILIQKQQYQQATIPLLKIANENKDNLWADDAVFMLGDIYDNYLNDKAKAKTYYQKIITDYPGSLLLNEARKRFRIIRGDLPSGS